MHLTIDTNVLINAFSKYSDLHLTVLYVIASTSKTICTDAQGCIEKEYRKKLSGREIFEKWYRDVSLDSRYKGRLSSRHVKALKKNGCHESSDHVFISVALESYDKILFTEDSDMGKGPKGSEDVHQRALKYLTDLGLTVCDINEAMVELNIV